MLFTSGPELVTRGQHESISFIIARGVSMQSESSGTPGNGEDCESQDDALLFVPIYSTRLVTERQMPFEARKHFRTPDDVAGLLIPYYAEHDREEFLGCLLNTNHALIGTSTLSMGGLSSSVAEPRQLYKVAVLANAAAVIIAHNHPSGNPEPSREDIAITRQFKEAGRVMGIPLRDHLIIAGDAFTSMAERGVI